jgi:diguanylate cyclase (GGDEF)-like protein
MVTVGLALLAVLVLEITADRQNESGQDVLSELANRRGFERRVRSLMSASPEWPHAVIVCDLDHFKSINDTYGYYVGDLVIQGLGRCFAIIRWRSQPQAASEVKHLSFCP